MQDSAPLVAEVVPTGEAAGSSPSRAPELVLERADDVLRAPTGGETLTRLPVEGFYALPRAVTSEGGGR